MSTKNPISTNTPSDANLYKEPQPQVPTKSHRSATTVALFGFLVISLLLIVSSALYIFANSLSGGTGSIKKNPFIPLLGSSNNSAFQVQAFSSEDEFKSYLLDSSSAASNVGIFGGVARMEIANVTAFDAADSFGAPIGAGATQLSPSRISDTNVQVEGIDEPDIVKASDGNIFVSMRKNLYYPMPFDRVMPLVEPEVSSESEVGITFEEDQALVTNAEPINPDIVPTPIPQEPQRAYDTSIINAFPPEEMKLLGGISEYGNILLSGNYLALFSDNKVIGYDVSDPTNPKQTWNIPYQNNTSYYDARLYGNELYLVTRTTINRSNPCPFIPLRVDNNSVEVACTQIFRPSIPVPVDVTYTAFKIDISSGKVVDQISLIGSYDAVLYMSEDNIYLTYTYAEDFVDVFVKFLSEEGNTFLPEEVSGRLQKLASYDISSQSKMTEFTLILEQYMAGLDPDDSTKLRNDMENQMSDFMKKYAREFQSTGISKIDVESLDLKYSTVVPGYPLNQFSLDEFEGNLRIATTSGNSNMFGTTDNISDVYVLDNKLTQIGAVKDLGQGERIYSARFIGDKGYLVTFRQTDPFYVLDLSSPNNPSLKGELKIPGYSSYLHPLDKNLILGVGKEGSKVKLSVFDVSDSSNPIETEKYTMDEYWSDVLNTHHAFLLDEKNKVFFIPGGQGGYIFSYANGLGLVKAIDATQVSRALYMDNYLYVITNDKIIVLNESNWERVKEFDY